MGVPENERSIIATCQASQTSSVTLVPMATNSHTLGHLLPSCRYHFRVGVANCYVDTPPGNGTLILELIASRVSMLAKYIHILYSQKVSPGEKFAIFPICSHCQNYYPVNIDFIVLYIIC